jgi:hypothetical protein
VSMRNSTHSENRYPVTLQAQDHTANPVILVETVRENMRRLTARELKDAKVGIKFMENMGGLAKKGVENTRIGIDRSE